MGMTVAKNQGSKPAKNPGMNLFRAVLAPSSYVTQIRSIDVAVLLGFKIITRLLSPELGFKTITPFFTKRY
jgi:hypothetical protein